MDKQDIFDWCDSAVTPARLQFKQGLRHLHKNPKILCLLMTVFHITLPQLFRCAWWKASSERQRVTPHQKAVLTWDDLEPWMCKWVLESSDLNQAEPKTAWTPNLLSILHCLTWATSDPCSQTEWGLVSEWTQCVLSSCVHGGSRSFSVCSSALLFIRIQDASSTAPLVRISCRNILLVWAQTRGWGQSRGEQLH